MTKWWYCGNDECSQFEHVASSDYQPNCPECQLQMSFIEENELKEVRMPHVYIPDSSIERLTQLYES